MKIDNYFHALLALIAVTAHPAHAATLLWDFGDDNAVYDAGTPVNFTVSAITIGNPNATVSDPVNSSSPSTGYTGGPAASGSGNIGNAFRNGAFNSSTSSYFELTLTPSAGYLLQIVDFDFGARSTQTGPETYDLRSDLDDYSTSIFSATVVNNGGWAYHDNGFGTVTTSNSGQAIVLRLYGYNAIGTSQINGRLDDIAIVVNAAPVPEPTSAIAGLLIASGLLRRRR